MDDREEERNELLASLRAKTTRHSRVKGLLQVIEGEINNLKAKFDDLDYELAMEKRTIIPHQKSSKSRKVRKFTLEEIKSIAVKLGVEITIKEEGER